MQYGPSTWSLSKLVSPAMSPTALLVLAILSQKHALLYKKLQKNTDKITDFTLRLTYRKLPKISTPRKVALPENKHGVSAAV